MAVMNERQTRALKTVTVLGSQAVARPDSRAAIVLATTELGPIAFEVTQRAIDGLREQLSIAEEFLRQPTVKN